METKRLRIVYMGTPDFAVAPLRRLVEEGYNIVGVVTMPDKPAGRGLHMQASAVKRYAVEAGLPVYQPDVARNRVGHAPFGNIQSACFAVAAISGSRSDQLGDNQRGEGERCHDLPAEP